MVKYLRCNVPPHRLVECCGRDVEIYKFAGEVGSTTSYHTPHPPHIYRSESNLTLVPAPMTGPRQQEALYM